MVSADLYLDQINFLSYLPGTDCSECGEPSCAAFLLGLKMGVRSPWDCPSLTDNQARAFRLVLQAKQILPQVPALELPRPGSTGLVQINESDEAAPLLVSGNSEFTQVIVSTMMAYTLSPFWLFFVDSQGDTVDMAMIYQSLTAVKISKALEQTALSQVKSPGRLILPGFAAKFGPVLKEQTGREVQVGPTCIAELPLFLGNEWKVPPDLR
jgi:CO dehydrogenase/acetyl-CoA synthase gamma subunit (corrinoid Fe-S protein)